MRKLLLAVVMLAIIVAAGWWHFRLPQFPVYVPSYREYAYITNGKSNSVTVIDLTSNPVAGFTVARTIAVGREPTGVAANTKKNEIYVVNTGSDNVSVIDAERNAVVATIGVHATPYFISVSEDGRRGYVANSASNNVSVIDLEKRVVLGNIRVGVSPGLARVSADGSTVVVSDRGDGTVSLIDAAGLKVRATIPVCEQPGDIAILPDSSKAFVACTGAGQVASFDLKSGKLLALLDVGKTPVNLALKPDGGELMVCNFDSDSISIIETSTDEVGESHLIGTHPVRGLVTADSRLYVSDSGSNTVTTYDIDAGTLVRPAIPPVGGHPDGLALSQSQSYLLVLDSDSGDVVVIQRRVPRKKFETGEYSLLTMIPVGLQPNDIVVKWFVLAKPAEK